MNVFGWVPTIRRHIQRYRQAQPCTSAAALEWCNAQFGKRKALFQWMRIERRLGRQRLKVFGPFELSEQSIRPKKTRWLIFRLGAEK